MRADQGAQVALYALGHVPSRDLHGDAALLVLGGAGRHNAVSRNRGNRQLVAFLREDRLDEVLVVLVALDLHRNSAGGRVGPLGRDLHLAQTGDRDIDRIPVLLHDGVALLAVGLLGIRLHVLVSLLVGDDVGQLEERGLHDGVDAVAHANLRRQIDRVDGVELDMLLGELLLHGSRQMLVKLFIAPLAVEQERAAILQGGEHVVLRHIRRVVAGGEVRRVDLIRGLDRRLAEAQVRNRQTAGLLGVVSEVRLRVHIGVVADDLDGVLVRADGAVRAEAVELAADRTGRSGVEDLAGRQAGVGHIVHNADGEVVLRRVELEVVKHSLNVGRRELLGAQAVTAADDLDLAAFLDEGGADVEVERLAQGAGLLGAVEHGDALAGRRDGVHEALGAERTIQVNAHQTDLLAHLVELVDGLGRNVAAGAHRHDDVLRIRSADVVKRLVRAAGDLADLVHDLFHNRRNGVVVLVASLAALEVDIRVLRGAAKGRVIRIQRAGAELGNLLGREQLGHVLISDLVDLLNLVRGTEAVEEVQERHGALQRGDMGDERHVLRLLNGVGSQHRKAGLAAGHHVGVVAEDRQRVVGQRTSAHVEDAGQQLAGDLVHVRDHQQQALGRGERRGERAGLQRAVHGTGGAGFGLHLRDADRLTKEILAIVRSPVIRNFRHRGRRGDRVDRCHFAERISDVADSGIAVNGHFLSHW